MSYRIEFTPSAARSFKKLGGSLRHRIAPKIDALGAEPRPHGAEKLAGHENRHRVRVGDYRIIERNRQDRTGFRGRLSHG